ncbi:MAG TPA: KH domain-containing protein [Candidatus Limnocylindria bacterium]|nr:KH domain-containing protein [Candidatus Limnocylindria bacterium]
MEQDQEFVEFLVKALVDHPTDVKTERVVDEMGVLITLHLNPEDMGQVIGRMGQTAKAIRTLLRVVGAKRKARVNLKIYEPEGSHRGPRREMGGQQGMGHSDMGHQGGSSMGGGNMVEDSSIDEFKL